VPQVLTLFAQITQCVVGTEACGSVHYWAREPQKLDQEVRLMAVQLIRLYRTKQKNERNAAVAICAAVSRPRMCLAPVKTREQ
jgi:transposase